MKDTIASDPFGSVAYVWVGGLRPFRVGGSSSPRLNYGVQGCTNDTLPIGATDDTLASKAAGLPSWLQEVSEHKTPWPADKPLPEPRDPFTTYVDELTGEALPV